VYIVICRKITLHHARLPFQSVGRDFFPVTSPLLFLGIYGFQIFTTTEPTEITEKGETDPLTQNIIGAAIEVHRGLGPGLLESAYEACLIYELRLRRLKVEVQKPLPIFYKDVMLDCGYRLDLVVEDQVIVEIKSVHAIAAIHEAQLLSYLRLSDYKVGLLINFNVKMLKDGIRRMRL
jgi:GxxExxY protein